MTRRVLITGGCGFIGSNLARESIEKGYELCLVDDLSRLGSKANLEWLRNAGQFDFHRVDITERDSVTRIIREFRPSLVFHLAGQVAMTTSLENPLRDFEVNVAGTIYVLEALRKYQPDAIVLFSSTNKVYGDLEHIRYKDTALRYVAPEFPDGFDESLGLDFRSPYGCSKGAADQYVLEYARSFGLRGLVFRHSSIFGLRQFSTVDQGWIGWFISEALRIRAQTGRGDIRIAGDGKQVRDVLFSQDLVECYFAAARCIERTAGKTYNIGGGMRNSLSLLELFRILQDMLRITINVDKGPWRAHDQKLFVADCRRAREDFGWHPSISKEEGLLKMTEWMQSRL
ncbi:MAG: SDR family NAD(P)-dependent oxidoreductase [Betaproteobacteria bacterium]|nr:MAG: SDR family NAD(P)-dependent oxidoreductase [Betaproteobacteria bacterium]